MPIKPIRPITENLVPYLSTDLYYESEQSVYRRTTVSQIKISQINNNIIIQLTACQIAANKFNDNIKSNNRKSVKEHCI